ncbi:NTP transferase domain-containing protein [Clostridia bacterium OttesenSCG-928-F22]|nr:NTP transferase domain-containing protein [Clostridia bacterium OttesenSCG-928-F22]
MKAVIMAGGEGQRLRPLTCTIPKPMVPVLGRPVMEYGVELLKNHGITKIATTLAYMPEVIKAHFGNGEQFGAELHHYLEETPLGTAGSVKNAQRFLDETFIVLSGDAITDIDLSKAIAFHKEKKSVATLVLKKVEIPLEFGVVIINGECRIQRFLEKPSWGEVFSDLANTGIYILEPQVFDYIGEGKVDFSKDVFPRLLADDLPIYGFESDGYWCDIGCIEQYITCQQDILAGRCKVRIDARCYDGVYVQDGAEFSAATIEPPCFIGANAMLEPGAKLGQYSVIGKDAKVYAEADIKRSILWERSIAGVHSVLRGAVLCEGAELDEYAEAHEGAAIGRDTVIGERARVMQNVGIWPNKMIECGCDITENIIWGDVKRHFQLNKSVASGRLGLELSPEYASRVGSSFAKAITGNIAVAHDGDAGAGMLYEALTAGVLAQGEGVHCLEKAAFKAFCFAVRTMDVQGGIYVFHAKNASKYKMVFIDEKGLLLARKQEKAMEDAFERRSYREHGKTGTVLSRQNIMPYYENTVVMLVGKLQHACKVALCAASRNEKSSLEKILQLQGAQVLICNEASNIKLAIEEGEAELGVYVDGVQGEIMLFDEHGELLEAFNAQVLASILHTRIAQMKNIILPVGMPDGLYDWVMSSGKDVVVSRTFDEENIRNITEKNELEEDAQELVYGIATDVVFVVAALLKVLDTGEVSLKDIQKSLQQGSFVAKDVPCRNCEVGNIMRTLYSLPEADKEMPEGVRIKRGDGWAAVLPGEKPSSLKVIAQGLNEEYAKELSEEYAAFIEDAKKHH